MSTIEEICSDARKADGYVALFRIHKPAMTGVLAVPANPPKTSLLRKLTRAIEHHPRLSTGLAGYVIERTETKQGVAVCEIRFAVHVGSDALITEFLEYMRQSRVMVDPIISDLRDFNPS